MAIKLEVIQSSNSNMNYVGSANSQQSQVRFGDQVASTIKLPRENADGIYNDMMNSASAIGQQYASISKTLEKASTILESHARLSDQNNGKELLNKLEIKRMEISASNQQRLGKDLALKDLPAENDRMFKEAAQQMISETPFNYSDSVDTAWQHANFNAAQQYTREVSEAAAYERKRSIENVGIEADNLFEKASGGVEPFMQAEAQYEEMANKDARVVGLVGPDVFRQRGKEGFRKAGGKFISDQIKADPNKAREVFDNGGYEPILKYYTESERGVISADIDNTIRERSNREYTETNRASFEMYQTFQQKRLDGEIVTESAVRNSGMTLAHQNSMIEDLHRAAEIEANKQKDIVEIQQSRQLYGNGMGLSDKQRQVDFEINYAAALKKAHDDPSQYKQLMDTIKADYGEIPEVSVKSLGMHPAKGTEEAWSIAVKDFTVNHPAEADRYLDKVSVETAYFINTELKPDGSHYSFGEATTLLQERRNKAKPTKDFYTDGFTKESPYKDSETWLRSEYGFGNDKWFGGKVAKDIPLPPELIYDFKNKVVELRQTHTAISDEEITRLAVQQLGWTKTSFGGREGFVKKQEAPETYYQGQQLENFHTIVDEYTSSKNIETFTLAPNPTGKGFIMYDTQKGLWQYDDDGKLKTFHSDPVGVVPKEQGEVRNPFEAIRNRALQSKARHLIIGADRAQLSVPELKDHPGLLGAIMGVESSYNASAVNKSSGAFGPYQFVHSTGKKYGITPNSPVEEQHAAAAQYFGDLLKRYKGNVESALKEYMGYYALAKPAGTVIGKNPNTGGEVVALGKEAADRHFSQYVKRLKKYGYNLVG